MSRYKDILTIILICALVFSPIFSVCSYASICSLSEETQMSSVSSNSYIPLSGGDLEPSLAMSMLSAASIFSSTIPDATETTLQNGSFEEPAIKDSTKNNYYLYDHLNLPHWYTTATDQKIELGTVINNKSSHMMAETYLEKCDGIVDGRSFIELANQGYNTIYQFFQPSFYDTAITWKLHHRARNGEDTYNTIAITIGPKQDYLPALSQNHSDFYIAMANYVINQKGLTIKSPEQLLGPYTVYSRPLEAGGIITASDKYSLTQTTEYTEQWTIWLASSDTAKWHEYSGDFATSGTSEQVFAISTIHTKNPGCGNILDGVELLDYRNRNFITNGSFETNGGNCLNHSSPTANIGWYTTDFKCTLERAEYKNGTPYFILNNVVSTTSQVNVMNGIQFGELNANEESSLYQYIKTVPKKAFEWSIYHRGREGNDSMALIIGERQQYDPKKKDNNKSNRDQLMQISDWLSSQINIDVGLDIVNFQEIGCSKKIILYTTKFDDNGGFVPPAGGGSVFSWVPDTEHTEAWNAWIITSGKYAWESYGAIDEAPDYDYSYFVPEDTNGQAIFSFVSFHSATSNKTIGNLLDTVHFQELYLVECYTTPNGGGTYRYNYDSLTGQYANSYEFTYLNNYIGYEEPGNQFKIDITPNKIGEDVRGFIGARINGIYEPYKLDNGTTNPCYSIDSGGKIYYKCTSVEKNYEIRLIFEARNIVYDSNGGDPYHYIPGDPNTGNEILLGDSGAYTSHSATSSIDGWKFIGWMHAATGNIFSDIHTISARDGTPKYLEIVDSVNSTLIDSNISYQSGITMVAQWKYRQSVTPTLHLGNDIYQESDEGGVVSIHSYDDNAPIQEVFGTRGTCIYTSIPTNIVITANAKPGYVFKGWYDKNTNILVSSTPTYHYKLDKRLVNDMEAHFDLTGYNLTVSKKVTGNMADRSDGFAIQISLTNAKPNTIYLISGNYSLDNDTILQTDSAGSARLIALLKHDENIMIENLPKGSIYSVTEHDYTSEGYVVSGNVTNETLNVSTTVELINSRHVITPSGISSNSSYFIPLLGCIASLLLVINYTKGKKEDSSE